MNSQSGISGNVKLKIFDSATNELIEEIEDHNLVLSAATLFIAMTFASNYRKYSLCVSLWASRLKKNNVKMELYVNTLKQHLITLSSQEIFLQGLANG